MVSELLQRLHTSPWGWWDPPPTVVMEAVKCSPSPFHHLPAVLARWGGRGCQLANATPFYKKGWKKNPWKYRLVSLTSVPGKVTEQINPSAITQHMQDNHEIRPIKQGLVKGRWCMGNLISSYGPPGDEEGCGCGSLHFSKAFDTMSHITLLEKLSGQGLDRCSPGWVTPAWMGRPREGWGNTAGAR